MRRRKEKKYSNLTKKNLLLIQQIMQTKKGENFQPDKEGQQNDSRNVSYECRKMGKKKCINITEKEYNIN